MRTLPLTGDRKLASYAGSVLETLREQMVTDELKCALGRNAIYLAAILEMAYVPNIRSGEAITPKKYLEGDYFPVVALRQGERVHIQHLRSRMPRQERGLTLDKYQFHSPMHSNLDLTLNGNKLGFTRGNFLGLYTHFTDDLTLDVLPYTRPAIAIRYPFESGEHRFAPHAVLLHEISHVERKIYKPGELVVEYMDDPDFESREEIRAMRDEAAYWTWAGEELSTTSSSLARYALRIAVDPKELANMPNPRI